MGKLRMAGLVLLAVVMFAFSGCSRSSKAARHLARADRYYAAGQFDKAEIEYINSARLNPQSSHAFQRLGLIYFQQGRFGRAVPCFIEALKGETNNFETRAKLALLYHAAGKEKEAREHADFVLSANPENEEATLLLADIGRTQADLEESRARLEKLPKPASEKAPCLVALGTIEFKKGNLDAARNFYDRALAANPKSSAAYLALGNLYWTQHDRTHADEAYKAATTVEDSPSAKIKYAQFKIQNGDIPAGKVILDDATKKRPDYFPAWIAQAELALSETNYGVCALLLERMRALDASNFETILLSGRMNLRKGDCAKAITDFKRAAELYAQAPLPKYQLARAYVADRQIDAAIAALNQALALSPGFTEAILLQAELKMKKRDFAAAVSLLRRLVKNHPEMPQAAILLAEADCGMGNFDDALDVYRGLEKTYTNNTQIPTLMGVVSLRKNDKAGARAAFNRALELEPSCMPALEQSVLLDIDEKQFAATSERVQAQLQKTPANPELWVLQARIFLAQHDTVQAESALMKAIEVKSDFRPAHLLLAQMYVGAKQSQKAIERLQGMVSANPKDPGVLMLLGMVYLDQTNYASARDAYEKVLAMNPKAGAALNNLACLYTDQFNDLNKAIDFAKRAREELPSEPTTADTLGWILFKQGNYQAALKLLQEAVDGLPGSAEAQYHLGAALYQLGQEEGARVAFLRASQTSSNFIGKVECEQCLSVLAIDTKAVQAGHRSLLEKRVSEKTNDPVALVRLAALSERDGNVTDAVTAYKLVVKVNPSSVQALTGLARLTAATPANKALAFEYAKAAYKLAPGDPVVCHMLGRLAFENGDYKWAATLLAESDRLRPGDPEVLFDLAEASYSLGKMAEAEAGMKSVVQAPTFTRTNSARQYLEMMALLSNPQQAAASVAQVEQVLKSNPGYVPALMVQAAIQENKSQINAAQRIYETVLARYSEFTPAKRKLAILYADSPGNEDVAYALALKAREVYPDDPEVAKALGVLAYRKEDYTRAVRLLRESAAVRVDDAKLFYFLGMTEYRLNHPTESKKALQRAVELNVAGALASEARRILSELK